MAPAAIRQTHCTSSYCSGPRPWASASPLVPPAGGSRNFFFLLILGLHHYGPFGFPAHLSPRTTLSYIKDPLF
jgi:hypothetical protein